MKAHARFAPQPLAAKRFLPAQAHVPRSLVHSSDLPTVRLEPCRGFGRVEGAERADEGQIAGVVRATHPRKVSRRRWSPQLATAFLHQSDQKQSSAFYSYSS